MNSRAETTRAWAALEDHYYEIADVHLRELFAQDPDRFDRMSVQACGLLMDYSKHRATPETLELLRSLADAADLQGWIQRMFAGEKINSTEGRAVLHAALRNRSGRPILVDGEDVMPAVCQVLERMRAFSEAVRSGQWRGHSGQRIRSLVNIGIGGSDLGPAMAATALAGYAHPQLEAHFVSNLDSTQLSAVLEQVDPESTLFIVESKTFSTQETLTNARTARSWLVQALGDERAVARHFVAVSTHTQRVSEFGIDPENMFGFWDWVGGRYSLWSAIGLPVAVMIGMDGFEQMLQGGHDMDEHFRATPWERNLPVILGLLGVWYTDCFGAPSHAVLPYDYALRLLPAYLQQLEMESNGKRVSRDGQALERPTCPVIWGGPGNNGQHAFYQLLHQGMRLVPADFIVAARGQREQAGHQEAVLANALAQTEALMRGRNEHESRAELQAAGLSGAELEAAVPHRVLPGNQPTTSLLYDRLSPQILGAIIALYEHKVFVQSVCWGNNAFDQWGVELGKQLARAIEPELSAAQEPAGHDVSTLGLIRYLRSRRQGA